MTDPATPNSNHLLGGAAWAVNVLGVHWELKQPDPRETAANVVLRYEAIDARGRTWRLLGWAASDAPAGGRVPLADLRWTLSRHGLDGLQHERPDSGDLLSAAYWASLAVNDAGRADVVSANKRGDYCAMGGDPRHDVNDCPGMHS